MRIFYILLALILIPVFSLANVIPDTVYAITPTDISAFNLKKNQIIDLTVLKTGLFSSEINYQKGDKIEVKICSYKKPKRGKRDGYFNIEILENNNSLYTGEMKASTPKDIKNLAEEAGITITGHLLKIPGFNQAIAVSKGLIHPNDDETRLKSAGKNLYESTPLTYVEAGKDFDVETDGIVALKVKYNNKYSEEIEE